MKKTISLILISVVCAASASAQSAKSVLKAMELANNHFQTVHPNPATPTFVKKMRTSNLWTRAVYYEGLCELIKIENDGNSQQLTQNCKYITDWTSAHKWSPRDGVQTRNADNYCCGQAYIDWALLGAECRVQGAELLSEGDKSALRNQHLAPITECMDNLLKAPESIHDWTWIDAIHMGLPVLTSLTALKAKEGDADAMRYANQGWKMYVWSRDSLAGGLFNKEEGLWWRDKDFCPPYKAPNGANCYWSRGNGWVYMALARAMEDLEGVKGAEEQVEAYKADFLKMTKAIVDCQRKDKFWNVDLLDESDFGGKELTGTAMFVYGLAWGVNHGVLTEKVYSDIAKKTWKRMVKDCLHKDGFLGYVQGTGKQPSDSQPVGYNHEPDFDDFGLGSFLLAGSEVYRMNN